MKKMKQFALSAMAIAILFDAGCSKEKAGTGGTGQNFDSLQEQLKYPDSLKMVVAGYDILVERPATECVLYANCFNINLYGISFAWRKISGPESFTMDKAKSLSTPVRNLQEGVYQFECKVTDRTGYSVADTMKVIVSQLPEHPQEIILTSLTWYTSWNYEMEIPDFYQHVAPGTFFKIYIRRANSTDWIEVKQLHPYESSNSNPLYNYILEDSPGSSTSGSGNLYIEYYGSDISDRPDVKILY
jgi:hypothetical protein